MKRRVLLSGDPVVAAAPAGLLAANAVAETSDPLRRAYIAWKIADKRSTDADIAVQAIADELRPLVRVSQPIPSTLSIEEQQRRGFDPYSHPLDRDTLRRYRHEFSADQIAEFEAQIAAYETAVEEAEARHDWAGAQRAVRVARSVLFSAIAEALGITTDEFGELVFCLTPIVDDAYNAGLPLKNYLAMTAAGK